VIEPNETEGARPAGEILAKALSSPIGPDGGPGGGLREFLSGARKVLIIVNDATRPTPTAAMLDAVMPALSGLEVRVLVATGAHRGPTEEEYGRILGRHFVDLRKGSSAHAARDEASMVDIGTTSRSTPVALNRLAAEAERIIVTGSVEPHYFAGYTGGRKAFLPGVAAFRTIEANHRLALDPRAASLSLETNPVHQDMVEALAFVKAPVFSIMSVLDREQRLAAAAAGDICGAFEAAVTEARRVFCVPFSQRAEVVISVAKCPMDIDLYQSQKAIDNGALALADGGTLVLVSSCRDGIGDKAYAELLARSGSPAGALELIMEGYRLGYHKAAKIAETANRARIVAKTELGAELLASMFIEASADLQAAVDAAIERVEKDTRRRAGIVYIPDGCVTVPCLEQ
jgi:nickel-dependent lactate racemase